jgi:signal transduction histidine kinase
VSEFQPLLLRAVNFLTRTHTRERRRNIWAQIEAKAERSSNLIRIGYVTVWLLCTGAHAPGNPFWSNVANLGVGGFWLLWSMGFQAYLLRFPYHSKLKYVSTTMDMVVITAMLYFYSYTAGPVYALKVPSYLNYFCCLGLAAMRYRLYLALYGGVTASVCYLGLYVYFYLHQRPLLGTGVQHATGPYINQSYIMFTVVYLLVFTFLTYFLVYNVKRLVDLRIREGEAAVKAKERAAMAASVAHEIKNPLEGIYGAAQLLKEESKGNGKFIDMILKDSVRLNGVVQQFLQFSRPFLTRMAHFDAAGAVRDFCREQAALAGEDKVRCASDPETVPAHADPEGLRQVLLNLYQNARRYQRPGLPVEVKVRGRKEAVEITVEDDGEGIPEANRERIFDPFFTTSSKGTGLGLAISRKIAREMGGDLYFEAKEPGARFVVVLKPGEPGARSA